MVNRKYNVVRDWFRFGAKRDSYYKGMCGVKFYGGLYGSRKAWNQSYVQLSYQEKDFLRHGQFNVMNSNWREIHKYPYLKHAAAFPTPSSVYLYECHEIDAVKEKLRKLGDSNLASCTVYNILFRREKSFLFFFSRSSRSLYKVTLDEELLRAKCRKRLWNMMKASSNQNHAPHSVLKRLPSANAKLLQFTPVCKNLRSSVDAIREVFRWIDDHPRLSDARFNSAQAMKVLLNRSSPVSFRDLLKWFIRNNDPRSNVNATQIWEEQKQEKKFMFFFYCPSDDLTQPTMNFLKKAMGFCISGIEEPTVKYERDNFPSKGHLTEVTVFKSLCQMQNTIDCIGSAVKVS